MHAHIPPVVRHPKAKTLAYNSLGGLVRYRPEADTPSYKDGTPPYKDGTIG
jgi:hypothetical protein